jgi:hypothetical protein
MTTQTLGSGLLGVKDYVTQCLYEERCQKLRDVIKRQPTNVFVLVSQKFILIEVRYKKSE